MSRYSEEIQQLVSGLGDWFTGEDALESGRMTDRLFPFERLFSPIDLGAVKVKNRIVMGPMGNINMAEETGRPGPKMIEYFIERAKGGTGLICTGLIPVNSNSDPTVRDVDYVGVLPRIDQHRSTHSAWHELADGCHSYGSRIFIQLTPGFGRVGNPECLLKRYRLPVSASWNRSFYVPQVWCRPLMDVELRKIVKSAGQSAADAKFLGMDGAYLHGHEGYLLEQMTNTAFNRRKHGRYSDWQAFGVDLVREIKRRCGTSYPVMYRIDLTLALNETYGARMKTQAELKRYEGERTVEMTLEYMANLVAAGVDAFDVDIGCYDNWWLPHPPNPMPPGVYLQASRIVKEYFAERGVKSNLDKDVPVVAVGKLGFPDLAERALRDGVCDMVMLARPLLADPHWAAKAYAGKVKEIIPCIGDQEGCLNRLFGGGHVECSVNPRTAFEDVCGDDTLPAPRKKKIAVVGSGPAGVYCACHAAIRGHNVTLYEKGGKAGGTLLPGSVPAIKYELVNYVDYLNNFVATCVEEHGLVARFDIEATAELLGAGSFDAIVFCTGTAPAAPPVEGIELPHVVQAVELLGDLSIAGPSGSVVVVGGGDVGCEVAVMLAVEMEKKVKVVEQLPFFMRGSCTANRGYMIHHLELAGVELMNCTKLRKVNEYSVDVVRNVSASVPEPYVTWTPPYPDNVEVPFPFAKEFKVEEIELTLPADLVVLSTGSRSNDALYYECVKLRCAPELHNVGDSMEPGMVLEATKAGYALGTSL